MQDLIKRGVVKRLSDLRPLSFLPFGVPSLDAVARGIPCGRVTVVYGPPDTGKTALMLNAVKHSPGPALWLDCEHRMDADWVAAWGINLDDFYVVTELETVEQAADTIAVALAETNAKWVVADGIGALLSQHDEGRKETQTGGSYAAAAKVVNRLLRRIVPIVSKADCAAVFIQHTYRDPHTQAYLLPGGTAQRHLSSLILQLRFAQGGIVRDADEMPLGVNVQWRIERCKYAPVMGRQGIYTLYFSPVPDPDGQGELPAPFISDAAALAGRLADAGFIRRSGSWYEVAGTRLHGLERALLWIHKHQDRLLSLLEEGSREDAQEAEMGRQLEDDEPAS